MTKKVAKKQAPKKEKKYSLKKQKNPRAIRFSDETEDMILAYARNNKRSFHGSVLEIMEEYERKIFSKK